jgi:hypothetical protein
MAQSWGNPGELASDRFNRQPEYSKGGCRFAVSKSDQMTY